MENAQDSEKNATRKTIIVRFIKMHMNVNFSILGYIAPENQFGRKFKTKYIF